MAARLLDYASRGDLRKLRRCIESGVDVNACDGSGNSSLYYAVSRDQQNCVEYLLDCGADPNRINKKGYTPVNEACLKNSVKCLELLVQYGGSLKQISPEHKESPVVSAHKKQSMKVLKFIKLLKKKDLTKNRHEVSKSEVRNDEKDRKNRQRLRSTFLPQISPDQLKVPHVKLFDDMPHMTLQSALWHSTLVTVKRIKGRERTKNLVMKEVDVLSRLRHPHVALFMAVCLDPGPDHLCLVMEHFQFASLNHLLYKTQEEMNLPERVHLLLDIAEGMIYVHSLSIVHGFLNSFSIFIKEKFRAKIGNLEFSQKNGDQKRTIVCCEIYENWMAPEQLLHEPSNIAADIYSFGVLMWETLARKCPWSWITGITVKQALCVDHMILPMLELWPSYIQRIMKECLNYPVDRPSFCSVHENLLTIKNSGEDLTSEVLDGAFPDWYEIHMAGKHAATHGKRTRTTSQVRPSLSTSGTSEINVMLRGSSSQANGRRRSTHVTSGLRDVVKMFSNKVQTSPREREIEQFGYEIAERLELVRSIRRSARNYTRPNWAKEVVLTRAIEGDMERVRRRKEKADSTATKDKELSRRGRRYSVFDEQNFERLLTTSAKYLKKDWSKVLHGMEKLRHSMKGFKEKVEGELGVYGKKHLTDKGSASETGVVETIHENMEPPKESTELLRSSENRTTALSPNKPFSERSNMQGIQNSKDGMDGPSQPCDKPLKTRRTPIAQETARQLSAVGKGPSTTSSDVANARNASKIKKDCSSEDNCNTFQINVHTEGSRSGGNLETPEITEKSERRTNPVAKAEASASDSPTETNFKLLNSPGEIQKKVNGEPMNNDKSKTRVVPEFEYQGRSCYKWHAQRFRPREEPRQTRQVQRSMPDVNTSGLDTNGSKKGKTSPPNEDDRLHQFRSDGSQEIPLRQTLKQQVSFKGNDDLTVGVDQGISVACGKTLSSNSCKKSSLLEVSGAKTKLAKSTIPKSATGNTRDVTKKETELEDTMSREATVQLSQEFSGVQVLCDKPHRQRASNLRLELVETNSISPTTLLGETETMLTASSSENNNPGCCKKPEKMRSNSLGQEPPEGLTIKCNSLMTKSAGGEVSYTGNTKLVDDGEVGTNSNVLTKPRSRSLGGEHMAKLRFGLNS